MTAGGFSTQSQQYTIRANLYSSQLKRIQEDELMGTRYVRMLTDFPDGDTLNIPSLGQAAVQDYVEGNAVSYNSIDTGNFTFTINKYKQTGTTISRKFQQDSWLSSQIEAQFVPLQARSLAVAMETDILTVGPDGQTVSNANAINGSSHRWVGSGTNETIDVVDFENALYSLRKANAPMTNLIAIVDPTVEYQISTQSAIVNLLTPNMQWGRIVNEGSLSGMQFKYNIFGFDVYVSNYLKSSIVETVTGKTTAAGVANLFFSAAGGDANPFIGLVRQAPIVDSEWNKDFQRYEYVTTCRYGFGLYRPENLCVVLTDTDQVSF